MKQKRCKSFVKNLFEKKNLNFSGFVKIDNFLKSFYLHFLYTTVDLFAQIFAGKYFSSKFIQMYNQMDSQIYMYVDRYTSVSERE